MPTYLPFDPNPRRPVKAPPRRTIDSQFHVLGPIDKYPERPGAAYRMPTATWEAALWMHKALGIERGIIVQTTTYGADHSVVLDGLAAMGPSTWNWLSMVFGGGALTGRRGLGSNGR